MNDIITNTKEILKQNFKINSDSNEDLLFNLNNKARAIRTNIPFDASLSYDQVCLNIIKVFEKKYFDAIKDDFLLSDYLSVRDLRVIIKTLKICDSSDLFNHRKPILCYKLQNFMKTELMIDKYNKYMLNKNEQPNNTIIEVLPLIKENKIDSHINENKPIISPIQNESINNFRRFLKPSNFEESQQAILFLQETNQFIFKISERITELERAISILLQRINEIELKFK